MWAIRLTIVCPKCKGKIKKNSGGEMHCVDCGIKVILKEVTGFDGSLCYDVIEAVPAKPVTLEISRPINKEKD